MNYEDIAQARRSIRGYKTDPIPREILEEILSQHTGQPIDRVHKDTDRDFVMEAQAAKDYGIIDEVISTRAFADRSGPIR